MQKGLYYLSRKTHYSLKNRKVDLGKLLVKLFLLDFPYMQRVGEHIFSTAWWHCFKRTLVTVARNEGGMSRIWFTLVLGSD